jgi:hypothetical protein
MAYSSEISRDNPAAFLFLVDQSGSMDEKMSTGKSKAEFVADALNRTIYTLIVNCTKSDGVRDYFDVGVIGYGQRGAAFGLGGSLSGKLFHPISALELSPLRVEDRKKLVDDGAGGVLERLVKFPVWFEPTAGGGTPMCAALTKAAEGLVDWCNTRPNGYPPTVVHLTDGASTDGDPEPIAGAVKQIATADGECLVFNAHISTLAGNGIPFPFDPSVLPDHYAKQLFNMSSELPPHIARMAADRGYHVGENSRGFIFNADPKDIVNFYEIGTRPRIAADR